MILVKFTRIVACIAAGVFLHRGAQSLHTYLHSDKKYVQEQAKLFAKTDLSQTIEREARHFSDG